ncbi:unnamed protein product [Caretta caretta]
MSSYAKMRPSKTKRLNVFQKVILYSVICNCSFSSVFPTPLHRVPGGKKNIRTAILGQTKGPSSPVSCLPAVANARCPRGNEQLPTHKRLDSNEGICGVVLVASSEQTHVGGKSDTENWNGLAPPQRFQVFCQHATRRRGSQLNSRDSRTEGCAIAADCWFCSLLCSLYTFLVSKYSVRSSCPLPSPTMTVVEARNRTSWPYAWLLEELSFRGLAHMKLSVVSNRASLPQYRFWRGLQAVAHLT